MSILDELEGANEEAHALLARPTFAVVQGRSFPVVIDAIDRTKAVETDGFMAQDSAPFVARKIDLQGHTVNSLQGQLLTYDGRTYRIAQVFDNGLNFTLRCTAKDQAK